MTATPLDPSVAEAHHLLVLPAAVAREEVEALALTEFDDAGWHGPEQLQLTGDAALAGPFSLTDDVRARFDLPAWTAQAYLLQCPVQRGDPVPPELRGLGGLPDAFPDGEPVGLEGRVLHHLLAQARRLGGALRCAGREPGGQGGAAESGAPRDRADTVLVPDPASAVDLTVYTTVWLEPEACLRLLRPVLGAAVTGSWEATPDAGPNPDVAIAADALAEHERARAALDPGEREWLHAEAEALDEEMLRRPLVLDGYAVIADYDDGLVQVAVAGEERAPWVLRHAQWAADGVVSYEVRWYWHDEQAQSRPRLALRRRRDEVRRLIERAAATLFDAATGVIVDDDGFLVAREHLDS